MFYLSILITTEENLINTENARTFELLGMGMALSDATLDRDKWDEKEMDTTWKELENLRHLYEYYQGATQTTVYLRSELKEAYNKFTHERHPFSVKIAKLQEDTLMELVTFKDMEWLYEREKQAIERIKYIDAFQQVGEK